MRHGKKINHLGRTHSHRAALLSNMASSLILHKRIRTTLPKARALRKYVEPLITKSKKDETHSRRVVFSYLQNKEAVRELFGDVAAAVADRPGGYTRILKLGTRRGDGAEMALIELVDFNEYLRDERTQRKSRRTRRGRGGGGAAAAAPAAGTPAPAAAEAVTAAEPLAESPAEELAAPAEAGAHAAAETVAELATEATAETLPDLQFVDADAQVATASDAPAPSDAPAASDDESKPEA